MSKIKADNFIEIPFEVNNLDRYIVRTSIKSALVKTLPVLKGRLLDIGCGKMPYRDMVLRDSQVKEYVGLDIASAIVYDKKTKPDLTWDGITMPIADTSFDCAFGTEVLEHCPDPEITMRETLRVLKKDGVFFFTVPFLWNLHEVPHDEYRYTPFALERIFGECDLQDVTIFPHGGWDMAMAQMIGMWIVATKRGAKRKRWARLMNPIMKRLIKKDIANQPIAIAFTDGQMINGLYGTARKKVK